MSLIQNGSVTKSSYVVDCFSCKESFDALDSIWCNCLTEERTIVCPRCLNCFCKSNATYREHFWSQAPEALWDRKMQENEKNFRLNLNPDPRHTKHPLILVVADSEQTRKIAIHMVESLGYAAIHASNGAEGIEVANKYLPELIITEALMPKMDGREMCRRLKANQLTNKIKVIVTTALYTQSKFRSEAFRTFHVDEYLSKPLSIRDLQGVLQKQLA